MLFFTYTIVYINPITKDTKRNRGMDIKNNHINSANSFNIPIDYSIWILSSSSLDNSLPSLYLFALSIRLTHIIAIGVAIIKLIKNATIIYPFFRFVRY